MRPFISLLLLCTGCDLVSGGPGGIDCTEIGCADGLQIDFVATTQGTWTVELDILDGGQVTSQVRCTATLPFDDTTLSQCDDPDYFLYTSGSALADSEHQLTGVGTSTLPAAVDLRILLDGQELLSQSILPEYETFYPNGEECGPQCTSTSLSVQLP